MSTFSIFFQGLTPKEKKEFAHRCGTSVGRLRNIVYGVSNPSVGFALILERESKGAVSFKELRPLDWVKYAPERQKEGA